jgi:hypothetical protein
MMTTYDVMSKTTSFIMMGNTAARPEISQMADDHPVAQQRIPIPVQQRIVPQQRRLAEPKAFEFDSEVQQRIDPTVKIYEHKLLLPRTRGTDEKPKEVVPFSGQKSPSDIFPGVPVLDSASLHSRKPLLI